MRKETVIEECLTCPQPMEMKKQICYVCITQKIVRGKWKLVIIWLLRDGKKRFSELQKSMPQIKQSYLTHQLRELETDGLVNREVYNVIPPKVEYTLTRRGINFLSVMDSMNNWGKQFVQESFQNGGDSEK
ncbi:winged helix-turn-helix transcriptional regulator [Sporomusa malonica]|uniref:Transcriptional regulator, HxlR family n=1 Tax=Sporomusa malonica TaxID=112901 RepID=A0A1W2F5F1_9FIRM|nr:helix-turn-helix domain-containing protein [Sporomusa malonica]SMD17155.1 transcriptional regulator, HxlR family [Sporomusa malonica]